MRVDTAALYTFAWRHAWRVPGPIIRGLGNVAADAVWALHGGGVRQLEKNLARAAPELDERGVRRLSRAAMRSYLRYFGEAFTIAARSWEQIDASVSASGVEHLTRHTDQGGSVVMGLGHVGNWDLAGAWATRAVAPVTTVAERLKPEELFQEFLKFREGIGLRILALGDGDVFRQLVRVARGGPAILPLLSDRDLSSSGVEVELFGQRARVAAGPAAVAISAGAPLVTTVITYERLSGARRKAAGTPWGIHIDFIPVDVDLTDVPRAQRVQVLTQAWVDKLAEGIHASPQDWHMLQKVFIEDLDPARYAETLAKAAHT